MIPLRELGCLLVDEIHNNKTYITCLAPDAMPGIQLPHSQYELLLLTCRVYGSNLESISRARNGLIGADESHDTGVHHNQLPDTKGEDGNKDVTQER